MKKFFVKWFNFGIMLETFERSRSLFFYWLAALSITILGFLMGGIAGWIMAIVFAALFSVISLLLLCLYEWIYFEKKGLN